MTSYEFDPFAGYEEYERVNLKAVNDFWLALNAHGTNGIDRVIDIACGEGLMTRLLLDALPLAARPGAVVGVDYSGAALELAAERLGPYGVSFEGVCSSLEEMHPLEPAAQAALFGNSIHNVSGEHKLTVLNTVFRSLAAGGWLLVNTTFHKEARPPMTQKFDRIHVKAAVELLRQRRVQRVEKGERMPASAPLHKEGYRDMMCEAGFEIVQEGEIPAFITEEGYRRISSYNEYVAGALPGFPPDAARRALVDAVEIAFARLEQEGEGEQNGEGELAAPRYWLNLIARVPSQAPRDAAR